MFEDLLATIKRGLLSGYATGDITVGTVLICLVMTALIASCIFLLYRGVNKNAFYNRSFNLSLVAMAVITSAIILTIQSNIVVSLGMVGALSIVRFRTAVKDPMDLVFLFWAISVGIICGAGFALIAVIASAAMAVTVLLFNTRPGARKSNILVVNALSYKDEEELLKIVEEETDYYKVRSRSASGSGLNLAVEVRSEEPAKLIAALLENEKVRSASLVEHDGDVTA